MVKAIFFDIDGTLIPYGQSHMPKSTRNALYKLREKNIKLFIATGRSRVLFRQVESNLDFQFDGYILVNGQFGFVGDQTIHEMAIPVSTIEQITTYFEQNKIPCELVEIDYQYSFEGAPSFQQSLETTLGETIPTLPVEALHRIYENNVYQISACITPEEEIKLLPNIVGCRPVRWSPFFLDFIPEDGGKSVGLQKFLDHFELTPDVIMAFGDGDNDIDMLQFAGIGVAMGNADECVKQAADYVTAHIQEDGIHQALEHFGLI